MSVRVTQWHCRSRKREHDLTDALPHARRGHCARANSSSWTRISSFESSPEPSYVGRAETCNTQTPPRCATGLSGPRPLGGREPERTANTRPASPDQDSRPFGLHGFPFSFSEGPRSGRPLPIAPAGPVIRSDGASFGTSNGSNRSGARLKRTANTMTIIKLDQEGNRYS